MFRSEECEADFTRGNQSDSELQEDLCSEESGGLLGNNDAEFGQHEDDDDSLNKSPEGTADSTVLVKRTESPGETQA